MLTDVLSAYGYVAGVVTLSLFDWNLPTEDDFNAFNFKDLSCRSVVHIGPISLNVTMPFGSIQSHSLACFQICAPCRMKFSIGASTLREESSTQDLADIGRLA